MDQISSVVHEREQQRFHKLKQGFPESEIIALVAPLFKLLDSLGSVKDEAARHLLEIIARYLDLSEKHLAITLKDIDAHIKHVEEKKSGSIGAKWLLLQQRLSQTKKNGALLSGRMLARYAGLLKRYEYDASARAEAIPSIDAELVKLSQLNEYIEAYRFLYRNYFQLFAQSGKGPLHDAIEQLRLAIKEGNLTKAQSVATSVQSILQPTRVVEIPQLGKEGIFANSIDIIGIAHQLTELEVSVNGERQQRLTVAIDGAFHFTKVRLLKGENIIRIASISVPPILFKDELNYAFELLCEVAKFIRKRIDPVTQQPFDEAEIEQWVRCQNQKCQTLSLRISWEIVGNRCFNCGSTKFWDHTQPEFHEKEIWE